MAGFDLGNSPSEVLEARIEPGSRVVMSTTNGTRVVEAAEGAAAVYAGSFVNAGALARALASESPEAEVVVVGCGWRGHRSSEDEAASGAIIHRLRALGAEADPRAWAVEEAYLSRPSGGSRGTRRPAAWSGSATPGTSGSASGRTSSPPFPGR